MQIKKISKKLNSIYFYFTENIYSDRILNWFLTKRKAFSVVCRIIRSDRRKIRSVMVMPRMFILRRKLRNDFAERLRHLPKRFVFFRVFVSVVIVVVSVVIVVVNVDIDFIEILKDWRRNAKVLFRRCHGQRRRRCYQVRVDLVTRSGRVNGSEGWCWWKRCSCSRICLGRCCCCCWLLRLGVLVNRPLSVGGLIWREILNLRVQDDFTFVKIWNW